MIQENHSPDAHPAQDAAPKPLPFSLVLILCAVMSGVMFFLMLQTASPRQPAVSGLDFRAFHAAGRIVWEGGPLYDLKNQFEAQSRIWPHYLSTQRDLLPFFNPPFVALALALIAWLPPFPAFILWIIGETFLLAYLLRVLTGALPGARGRLAFLFLALSACATLIVLVHGQFSFFLALCLVLAWRSFREETRRGDLRAGVWLALLCIKPQLLLMPIFFLVFRRRTEALRGFAATLAVLGLVSLLVTGFDGLMQFKNLLQQAATWDGAYGIHPHLMHSWRSLLTHAYGADKRVMLLWIMGVALVILVLAFASRGEWKPKSARFDLQWALLVFAMTFCSAHLNAHDTALWLVPMMLMMRVSMSTQRAPWLNWLAVGAFVTPWMWLILYLSHVPATQVTVPFQIMAMTALYWALRCPEAWTQD